MRNMIINSKQQHRDAHAHSDFPWGGEGGWGRRSCDTGYKASVISLSLDKFNKDQFYYPLMPNGD